MKKIFLLAAATTLLAATSASAQVQQIGRINQNGPVNQVGRTNFHQGQGQGQEQRTNVRNRQEQTANASANNRGNNQTTTFQDRRQAPSVYGSFSSVSGNPCEGAPFGLGASAPGFGALLQLPRESKRCWNERDTLLGLQMRDRGIRISENALIAIFAGNDVAAAIQNNPYNPAYDSRRTTRRAVRRVKH